MRAVFGILSLLVVLAVVGIVAQKQLGANRRAVPAAIAPDTAALPIAVDPNATVKAQSQQIQQQYKQALDAAMQPARALDDAEKP